MKQTVTLEKALPNKNKLFDLERILNKIPTPVICATETGEVIFVNESFANVFGFLLSDIPRVEDWWLKAYPDAAYRRQIRSIWQQELALSAETGLLRRPVEGSVVCKDGTVKTVEAHMSTIEDDAGRLYIVSLLDISGTKKMLAELGRERMKAEAASAAKSNFFANMTHELRTPLNAIIGFADVILAELRGPIGNEHYKTYIEDILASGNHLLEIINDLLDLSKLEARRMTIEAERIDTRSICTECSRLFAATLEQHALHLSIEVPRQLVVFADHGMLKRILLNLLSNAIKFTPRGGRITLGANTFDKGDARGAWTEIYIEDSGIGMSEEDLAIALQRFGQIDTDFTRRSRGTGLGLPIVNGLIDLHNGGLRIASIPDQGTRVTIELPPPPIAGDL